MGDEIQTSSTMRTDLLSTSESANTEVRGVLLCEPSIMFIHHFWE